MNIVTIIEDLQNSDSFLIFDGAMGTMLQKYGLQAGDYPEELNFTHPKLIQKIHSDYLDVGAQIIISNTFGANSRKLKHLNYSIEEIIGQAIKLAKADPRPHYVALDMGPLGELLEPIGSLSFTEAYDLYKEQVQAGVKAGADLILIETISDLYEARAAILAAKENSDLPVFCTMTFEEKGRTLTGTDPIIMVHTLEALGVDALGVNCSLGPKEIIPIVQMISDHASIPIIVSPNAGLPEYRDGETIYKLAPEEFADYMSQITSMGVKVVGGCCGTNPEFIRQMILRLKSLKPIKKTISTRRFATSSTKAVELGKEFVIVGERINPTGNKLIKAALREHKFNAIYEEALSQKEAGAHILDVNIGIPDIDEISTLQMVVKELQTIVDLPLQIDSSNSKAIEQAVRVYNGVPIINSVSGDNAHMQKIFPIVKKYGTFVIGLTMDERGIPKTIEERVAIADKIISTADQYGIPRKKIIIDTLVLTASAQQGQSFLSLQALHQIKEQYNVQTILGVSNVSFGLPYRPLLNQTYLTMALSFGLDLGIIDPKNPLIQQALAAFRVLIGWDKDSIQYIENYHTIAQNQSSYIHPTQRPKSADLQETLEKTSLRNVILKGLKDQATEKTKLLLQNKEPMEIVDSIIIPTLDELGSLYDQNHIFLPQLLRSAETVKKAFHEIKQHLQTDTNQDHRPQKILLATVKGDVHDIGKNIVKVLLENYGFEIIDLGKNVEIQTIIDAIDQEKIKLVGLSALMTTTVENMEKAITKIHSKFPDVKVMVGGAVLNSKYASMIKADYYGRDAQAAVHYAKKIFK